MVWLSTEVAPSDGVKLLGDALSRAADEVVTDLRGRTLESDYVLDVAIEAIFSRRRRRRRQLLPIGFRVAIQTSPVVKDWRPCETLRSL